MTSVLRAVHLKISQTFVSLYSTNLSSEEGNAKQIIHRLGCAQKIVWRAQIDKQPVQYKGDRQAEANYYTRHGAFILQIQSRSSYIIFFCEKAWHTHISSSTLGTFWSIILFWMPPRAKIVVGFISGNNFTVVAKVLLLVLPARRFS